MDSVVLFGLGPAGLFLSRELAKNNVRIIGIGRRDDVGLYSKYVEPFVAETKEEIINIINKIKTYQEKPLVGYICSDQYLTLFLNDFPEIFKIIRFVGLSKENYELINNKQKITKVCTELGLRMPREYTYQDLVSKNVAFPLAFKLNTKEINSEKNPIGKLKIVNSKRELNDLEENLNRSRFEISKIVVQEYIQGDNSQQFSFGGYFINGKEKAGIVVNQVGQYPQGVSSLVLEVEAGSVKDKIKGSALKFADYLKYTGFLEMEFKVYKETIYLMDINPRVWGWVSILGKKYPDFHNILGENNKIATNKTPQLVMWKSPIRVFLGKFKETSNEKIEKKDLVRYQKSNIAYDLYNPNDLKPLIAMLKISLLKLKKKFR